jgi:hypothetical protein
MDGVYMPPLRHKTSKNDAYAQPVERTPDNTAEFLRP